VVEPLIQMCTVSASRLNTIEMAVYMVNCLHQQQVVLSLFEYTESHLELIQAQVGVCIHIKLMQVYSHYPCEKNPWCKGFLLKRAKHLFK